MEAQPSPSYYPHASRKRMFTGSGSGSSSAFMDEDVIEISPPQYSKSKALKQKEVVYPEVINVDSDEDADLMIIGETVASGNDKLSSGVFSPAYNISSGDESGYDMAFNEDYYDLDLNGFMIDDDTAMLQAHFDSVDIPTGVEAPVPWWPSSKMGNSQVASSSISSSSSSGTLLNSATLQGYYGKKAKLKKKSFAPFAPEQLNIHTQSGGHISSSGPQPHMVPGPQPVGLHGQNNLPGWMIGYNMLPSPPMTHPPYSFNVGPVAPPWAYAAPTWNPDVGKLSKSTSVTPPVPFNEVEKSKSFPIPINPWSSASAAFGGFTYRNPSIALDNKIAAEISVPKFVSAGKGDETESLILGKLQAFKKFDTVEDPSGHYFANKKDTSKQPTKAWVKKIQEEWRILENDLPDTIFVRVYETRMDLLRAVIIGAEGTPYHDGLYFFDVHFPSSYPKGPPLVHYHSRGLRLNPNLYNCGKVCLSLLNTWAGRGNEKWVSGVSTALQVLVSIQGLILNSKPYFNEPGYAGTMGTPSGEKRSEDYNENTYLLALKTMLYTMRQPPQPFEELVFGHFFKRAHDILAVCRAYLDGAPVGSLVNGKVQDTEQGKHKGRLCSNSLKMNLPQYINSLCVAFEKIGVKDVMKYSVPVNSSPVEMPSGSRKVKNAKLKIK